uniref:Uncharacterized protein n=1 Tax=Romanomermis culicivorax TaxID=13658 RepID=A0A915KCH6_ROMCU
MSNSPERRLATKSDYLEMCNSNRVKCITADICEKLDDKKTEQSEVREEIHITPEKRAVLEDLSAISNHMMLGFMMRDLISDYYHGNKAAMVIDSSFLLTAIFSPLIVNSLSKRAAIMIANKFKISGYLTKGLAYGVSRAISLYVLYDFIDNTIKYIGNKSDESAKTSMEINGAFLAIDVIVDVIGILEVYGIIAGASAVAGPIGGIIAVGLVVGLNFHASHKRLQQIEKIVHLSSRDKQEEALRGFFRMDPAANVQELMNEAIANEHLKKHAMTFLANQNTYDRYFTKSGTIVDGTLQLESDATIDVQTEEQFFVSRTSPKSLNKNFTIICKLRQELKELHNYTDHYIIDDHRTINSSHSSESIRLFTGDNYLAEQTARYAKNQLKSTPLVFNSKYKFIFLSNINTEWFSKVQINATLGEMEFYHMGNNSLEELTPMVNNYIFRKKQLDCKDPHLLGEGLSLDASTLPKI